MELQTEPVVRYKSSRVKAIVGHATKPEVAACLFSGEVQLYDRKTFVPTRTLDLAGCPVRSGAYMQSQDWFVFGLDDGMVLFVEYGSLSVVSRFRAHDDFVRKIVLDEANSRFLTVSDDNTAKLWTYGASGAILVRVFKDARHFVMDAVFAPTGASNFLTVSLDKKVRFYSSDNPKAVEALKGHKDGINCITFFGNNDMFATGSDDSSIMIWDLRRRMRITALVSHTNNVVGLCRSKNGGFMSCSEDGTLRLWNKNFRCDQVLSFSNRVWCAHVADDCVFVGTDEEVVVFREESRQCLTSFSNDRLFYTRGDVLRMVRTSEMVTRDLGHIEPGSSGLKSSPNGKLIGVMSDGEIGIFSTLGMRKKMAVQGQAVEFVGESGFWVLDGESLAFYSSFTKTGSFDIAGLTGLLYVDEECVVVSVAGRVEVLASDGTLIQRIDAPARMATRVSGCLVLFSDESTSFYSGTFELLGEIDTVAQSFCASDVLLCVSTHDRTLYFLVIDRSEGTGGAVGTGSKSYCVSKPYPMKFLGRLIGVSQETIFHIYDSSSQRAVDQGSAPLVPEAYKMDTEFILFQIAVLHGTKPKVTEAIHSKAVAFYEELGMHEQALEIATGENQRFEILLKMNRLDEALALANAPAKYRKLGQSYMRAGLLSRAAECFAVSGERDRLLLTDVFSDKRWLASVAQEAYHRSENNLAFIAGYKAGKYDLCVSLLRNTPFYNLFQKTYCSDK